MGCKTEVFKLMYVYFGASNLLNLLICPGFFSKWWVRCQSKYIM